MKKIVALTALSTVLSLGTAEAGFGGWSAGGSVGYAQSLSQQHIKGSSPAKRKYNAWAPTIGAILKYGKESCNTYLGADFGIGYSFMSKKRAGDELSNGLTLSLGGRIGTKIDAKTLLFFRLGFQRTSQTFKYTWGSSRLKDNFANYTVAPGVGAEWDMGDMKLELMYQYAMTFATREDSNRKHNYSKKPYENHITVGVTFPL